MSLRSASRVVGFMALSALPLACAASHAQTAAPDTPGSSVRITGANAPVATSMQADKAETAVTSEPAPSPAAAAAQRWTDEEIFGAAIAAEDGARDETKVARKKSHGVRAERFALRLLDDTRELQNQQDALARAIAPQESPLRQKVREARTQLFNVIDATPVTEFDREFVDAEARFARSFLRLLDEEMIPGAHSADLRNYLVTLRARMSSRLAGAEEIETRLP